MPSLVVLCTRSRPGNLIRRLVRPRDRRVLSESRFTIWVEIISWRRAASICLVCLHNDDRSEVEATELNLFTQPNRRRIYHSKGDLFILKRFT